MLRRSEPASLGQGEAAPPARVKVKISELRPRAQPPHMNSLLERVRVGAAEYLAEMEI
jgi:hypothetical protein